MQHEDAIVEKETTPASATVATESRLPLGAGFAGINHRN